MSPRAQQVLLLSGNTCSLNPPPSLLANTGSAFVESIQVYHTPRRQCSAHRHPLQQNALRLFHRPRSEIIFLCPLTRSFIIAYASIVCLPPEYGGSGYLKPFRSLHQPYKANVKDVSMR